MTRSRWSAIAVVMAFLLLAGACGDDDDSGSADPGTGDGGTVPETTAGTTPGDDGGGDDGDLATTLRGRFAFDVATLDPILLSNTAELAAGQILYEPLIEPAVDGDGVVNVLAETWDVADDGLSIEFTLKEGI